MGLSTSRLNNGANTVSLSSITCSAFGLHYAFTSSQVSPLSSILCEGLSCLGTNVDFWSELFKVLVNLANPHDLGCIRGGLPVGLRDSCRACWVVI